MSFYEIINLIFPLLLISLLLYIVLYFVKKYSFKRVNNQWLDIKVINNHMIMPKKFLSVIKIKDQLLILGISENNISLLKEIPIEGGEFNEPAINYSNQSFKDILKIFIPR